MSIAGVGNIAPPTAPSRPATRFSRSVAQVPSVPKRLLQTPMREYATADGASANSCASRAMRLGGDAGVRARRARASKRASAALDRVPAVAIARDRARVDAPVAHDQRLRHREQQRGVAAGADRDVLVGLARGLGAARIDHHQLAAALRACARSRPRMSGAVIKLPFETTGLAPTQRKIVACGRRRAPGSPASVP